MGGFFRRQLTVYVEHHRDPRNFAMHVIGILLLFTGAVLPLTRVTFAFLGIKLSLAVILALPVLLYWLLLDTTLGLGILVAAAALLSIATAIADHADITMMWLIFCALIALGLGAQVIGHKVFEGRDASLFKFPSHLLLGPMFVMAKVFIFFGFRRDLVAIIEPASKDALSTRKL